MARSFTVQCFISVLASNSPPLKSGSHNTLKIASRFKVSTQLPTHGLEFHHPVFYICPGFPFPSSLIVTIQLKNCLQHFSFHTTTHGLRFHMSVHYICPGFLKPGSHNTADKLLNYLQQNTNNPAVYPYWLLRKVCILKPITLLLHLTTDINDSICSFLGTLEHE